MGLISYIKTVWKAGKMGGTAFTPERFNNIEDGIEKATEELNYKEKRIMTLENTVTTLNSNLSIVNNNLGYTAQSNPDYIFVTNADWIRKTSILLTNENSTNVKEKNGFLITFGFATGTGDCCVQINIPFSGNTVHIRTCWYTQWRNWNTFNSVS